MITNIKSIYFQLVEHEKNVGCNKSASNPNAEPKAVDLPTAVGDLSQLLLSTATEVATSIAPTRPKRTSLASYSAVILPPSPEREAKRARALRVERTSAVQAAEEATSDLVTRFQMLQTRYDSAKLEIDALRVEVAELKQNNLSRLSMQSARTERDLEASAVFDPQDQTPFDTDTTAGRKLFSTALKSLRTCISSKRGEQECARSRPGGAAASCSGWRRRGRGVGGKQEVERALRADSIGHPIQLS